MDPMTLRSGHLTVTLDPERGGEITSITAGDSANALAYYDWEAPLAAGPGPSYGSSELDWLSNYRAGWQFLFPNAGAETIVDGVPVAFHGETSLAPVRVAASDEVSCTVHTFARLPLELTRTVKLAPDRPTLLVDETVRNIGTRTTPFLWGHHPTFPAIPSAQIDLPAASFEVEPTAPGTARTSGGRWPAGAGVGGQPLDLSVIPADEMVRLLYLHDMESGWAALRNPPGAAAPGIAMSWDLDAYPCLWLWLQNGDPGFPWYGRGRMLGIEPQRYWPFDGLAGAVQRGQAMMLEPDETVSSWLTLTLLPDACGRVRNVDRDGTVQHE